MYTRTEPLEISLQVDSEILVWRGGGYLKKFETITAVPKIVVVVIWYDKKGKNYINMESMQTTMIIWIDLTSLD